MSLRSGEMKVQMYDCDICGKRMPGKWLEPMSTYILPQGWVNAGFKDICSKECLLKWWEEESKK